MTNSNLKNNEIFFSKVINQAKAIEKTNKSLKNKGFVEFTEQLYKFAPLTDFGKYSSEDLVQISLNLFRFIDKRKSTETLVNIYNPEKKVSNWESSYTIIEMVNLDTPFIVDSLIEEIHRHDLKIFGLLHPVLSLERNKEGKLLKIRPVDSSGYDSHLESIVHIQVSYIDNPVLIAQLEKSIQHVMKAIKSAVKDWYKIVRTVSSITTEFSATAHNYSQILRAQQKEQFLYQLAEIKEFFEWLKDNNFVFLGYAAYNYQGKNKQLVQESGSELGIFKLGEENLLPKTQSHKHKKVSAKLDNVLEITKANKKSIVHRPVHMDYIGLKHFDESGEFIGEHRFLGLFTSKVYFQSARNIPIIRTKIESVRQKSGFSMDGHSGKALTAIMEDLPRDELFQISEDTLYETVIGIELLSIRPSLRLFTRKDDFERFISCIIFLPRDSMSTELRLKMESILCQELNGTVSNHYTQITDSPLARIQVIVKTTPGEIPNYNTTKIEEKLAISVRKWSDNLFNELAKHFGSKEFENIFTLYREAFSVSYTEKFSAEDAYYDILRIEKVIKKGLVNFDIYESSEGNSEIFEFKVFSPKNQISLSSIMPILANMGLNVLDEHTYVVKPLHHYQNSIWIHRFLFTVNGVKKPPLKDIKKNFELSLDKIWSKQVEDDAFNKLILLANLRWRDVVLLRAYSKYIQQSAFKYSQFYIQKDLVTHFKAAKYFIEYFYIRFDPEYKGSREKDTASIKAKLESLLGNITNLAEDRVIRGFFDVINATIRTNFFQKDASGNFKDYISFKFASEKISWLPKPKPYAEIFVYSARVEGIHLRGGKVARGGLRWSDRSEDFRTEVLGLMKAQMAKNSVIIPVGSKGGFIVKNPPTVLGREAVMKEGIECYKTFLRGLLDITDNLVGSKIVVPESVVRYDVDDPYLVVAADKGTATFSDYANQVAAEYGFWLGDAFASGGSAGYDHKKMAITARGAWISVRTHFNELGIDVDKNDFTVVGIGDMSGDVFGNGMLLSKHIKLVAAFNHMHIFIDPNPDVSDSFKERKRLFNLPRSQWSDYNSSLISKGGGIFERSAKSIKITPEMKALFAIDKDTLTPDELIKSALTSKVDLLWNGGIGTYVKSRAETNESVGDRNNDGLRINGSDIGAKVVAEGGNLGLTQLGRIEYAQKGGRLNTDAIDNSAGVDCSDHEVNIKITLGKAVSSNNLTTAARNKLLESMTEDVALLVLKDNKFQNQAITNAVLQGTNLLETQARLLCLMEREGSLDRALEFLPDQEELQRRIVEGKGLTRPEVSVVMAYSKLRLYDKLVNSDLPDEPYYEADLIRYFPTQLQKKYLTEIKSHPLRREIIATTVTNSIINRIGGSMFFLLCEGSGLQDSEVAKAYTIARDIFGLKELWNQISELKNVDSNIQKELFLEMQSLVEHSSLWFMRNINLPIRPAAVIKDYQPGMEIIAQKLTQLLPTEKRALLEARYNHYRAAKVPEALARAVASFERMASAYDIVKLSHISKLPVEIVGKVYFNIGIEFHLSWMRNIIRRISSHSYWQSASSKGLLDEIYDQQKNLTLEIVKSLGKNEDPMTAIDNWRKTHKTKITILNNFVHDIKAQTEQDFAMMTVAVRKVKDVYKN